MDDLDWAEELCYKKYTPPMELPEDLLFHFNRLSPKVQEIIDKLDLEIET